MSPRSKLAIILIAIFLFAVGAAWAVLNGIVLANFRAIEAAREADDISRLQASLAATRREIVARVNDYATWDNTLAFLQGRAPAYPADNFSPAWFANYDVDLVLFADDEGDIRWERNRTRQPGQIETSSLLANVVLNDAREGRPRVDRPASGFVWTQHGPLLYAARPATASSGAGAPTGLVAIGRYLSVSRLKDQTLLDVDFVDAAAQGAPDDVLAAMRRIAASRRNSLAWGTDGRRSFMVALRAAQGRAIGAILARRPNTMAARTSDVVDAALPALAASFAVALFALWLMLQRALTRKPGAKPAAAPPG